MVVDKVSKTPTSTLDRFFGKPGSNSEPGTPESPGLTASDDPSPGASHFTERNGTIAASSGVIPVKTSLENGKKRKVPPEAKLATSAPLFGDGPPSQISSEETSSKLSTQTAAKRSGRKRQKTGENDNTPFPVSLKKGKVVFQEKSFNLAAQPNTIADLAEFFKFRQQTCGGPLDEFPQQFRRLLAALIQESSLPVEDLVEHVKKALCPLACDADSEEDDEDSILPREIIRNSVNAIGKRTNYGIGLDGAEPSALAVWRWEVDDLELFAEELRETVKQRREKRQLAAASLLVTFSQLSENEKAKYISGISDDSSKASRTQSKKMTLGREKEARQKAKERKAAEKAAVQAEKERKAAERKAEKERKEAEKKAEKEKKEAEKRSAKEAEETAKGKQPSIAGFFSRIKKEESKIEAPVGIKSQTQSFWEHFPPFHLKGTVCVAPYNRFWRELPHNLIETLSQNAEAEMSLPIFARIPTAPRPTIVARRLSNAMELDVTQTDEVALKLLNLKWKLLQFGENVRPAYWGTWSRKSLVINGRRPFAKDANVLDYEYDSEAEWEEDEPGEELRSEDGEEEDDEDELDADEENWLVPHGYLSDDEGVNEQDEGDENIGEKTTRPPIPFAKRGKELPKWGILAPLVPDILGPFFGVMPDPTLHPLSPYCAQPLFNDISTGIDPLESDPTSMYVGLGDWGKTDTGKKTPSGKKNTFPDDKIGELASSLSGKTVGLSRLIDELKNVFPDVPKAQIENKIREIAVREKRGGDQKACWYLKDAVASSMSKSVSPLKPRTSPSFDMLLSNRSARDENCDP